uniref:Uncharacterized protein n=1 Tax=Lepeophtheirus salmonis TaxID=72036 RepID=A0A0K2U078_LEPSM
MLKCYAILVRFLPGFLAILSLTTTQDVLFYLGLLDLVCPW